MQILHYYALILKCNFGHPVRDRVSFVHRTNKRKISEIVGKMVNCFILSAVFRCCNLPVFILNMVIGLYFDAFLEVIAIYWI